MRPEVKHAYALYEKITGTYRQDWKCIGVSNRRKDVARLSMKSAELYMHPELDVGINLGDMVDSLCTSNSFHIRFVNGMELEETMNIEYQIRRISIDDISRRRVEI